MNSRGEGKVGIGSGPAVGVKVVVAWGHAASGEYDRFRIKHDGVDGRPVASSTGPTLRLPRARSLVERTSLREDATFAAEVTFVGGDEADRAVAVLGVVPADEFTNPSPRAVNVGEGARRICGAVLERPEERLGIRIIVGDVGPAEGGHD